MNVVCCVAGVRISESEWSKQGNVLYFGQLFFSAEIVGELKKSFGGVAGYLCLFDKLKTDKKKERMG